MSSCVGKKEEERKKGRKVRTDSRNKGRLKEKLGKGEGQRWRKRQSKKEGISLVQWMMEAVKENLRKLSGKRSRGKKGSKMALPWTLKYMYSYMMYIYNIYIYIVHAHDSSQYQNCGSCISRSSWRQHYACYFRFILYRVHSLHTIYSSYCYCW